MTDFFIKIHLPKQEFLIFFRIIECIFILIFCYKFLYFYQFSKGVDIVANQAESQKISVNSTISLKGIVKAIFNDTIHVQIGGKIITLPTSDFTLDKPAQ